VTHLRLAAVLCLWSAPLQLAAQQTVQLPARDKILSEKPAVLFSIGAAEGESWEMLSNVRAAAFDSRDNLYVLDASNARVLMFDANGKFVRAIGKKGQGPGELMTPSAMTVTSNGIVAVADGSRQAFSLFKPDGTFLNNVTFPETEGTGAAQSYLYAHPRGGVVAQMFVRRQNREAGTPTVERKAPIKWFDLSSSGKATQLYEFTLPSITPNVTPLSGGGVSITTVPPNWSPPYVFGLLPNGSVVALHDARYRLHIVNAAGKVERILERPIAPKKGTQKDKEAFITNLHANFDLGSMNTRGGGTTASSEGAQARLASALKNAPWLEVVPVVRRLATDPTGRIWLARTPADFGVYGPVDLIRADGSYIGTIAKGTLPAAVSATGRAAFIERDDLAVEHVTVKQLPAKWR
jgi:hypothetical protein